MQKRGVNNVTVRRAIDGAAELFREAGIPSPRRDAEILTADVLGVSPKELAGYYGEILTQSQFDDLNKAVRRRAAREPLQYIMGWAPFLDLKISVFPGVFVPRPETEGLAELCLTLLSGREAPLVVETCAGTGAVAFWIKRKRPDARVVAIEKYNGPLSCLKANASLLKIDIEVLSGNLLEPVFKEGYRGVVDMVVANPPYISSMEMTFLPPEVIGWEARTALHGGLNGTDFYPVIIDGAAVLLRKNGILAFEISDAIGEAVTNRIESSGLYEDITLQKDLAGRPRYIYAKRSGYLPNSIIERLVRKWGDM